MTELNIKNLRIVALVGKSGAGKSSVVRILLALYSIYRLLISNTTRAKRQADLPGEYRHVDDDAIQQWVDREETLWTTPVNGKLYATRKDDFERALADTKRIYLAILTPEIVEKLMTICPEKVLPIYIDAPLEALIEHMRKRGDTQEQIDGRVEEFSRWDESLASGRVPYQVIDGTPSLGSIAKTVHQTIAKYIQPHAS